MEIDIALSLLAKTYQTKVHFNRLNESKRKISNFTRKSEVWDPRYYIILRASVDQNLKLGKIFSTCSN